MPIIDAHSHLWTPDTLRYPLAPGFAKEDMKPPSWTDDELLAHARPSGVERVVLIQMSFYGFDNSYMLDRMRARPGVFGGVAVIDWKAEKPDHAMAEMARHGVRGFRVRHGDPPADDWMETPGLDRMFRYAADHNLAICPLMDPRGLPSLARMCLKHPRTTVVIDHFCRIGLDGEIREREIDALSAMAQHPKVHVKISAFYALGKKKPPHEDLEPMIRRLSGAFGAKRLMWGSDCPFAVANAHYCDSLSLVRDGCPWLPAEDRKDLLYRTAERLFFK